MCVWRAVVPSGFAHLCRDMATGAELSDSGTDQIQDGSPPSPASLSCSDLPWRDCSDQVNAGSGGNYTVMGLGGNELLVLVAIGNWRNMAPCYAPPHLVRSAVGLLSLLLVSVRGRGLSDEPVRSWFCHTRKCQ